MSNTNKRFSTRNLVIIALFISLSYVISLISFPLFPATPYLKLDFGNVCILLIGFLLGPIEAVIVCAIKETISIVNSATGGVGELANFLMTTSYVLLPCILYRYKKGIKTVILSLWGACAIGTAAALLANRFIIFPLYMGDGAAAVFNSAFWYVLLFNLIKTVAISLVSVILYKRLSLLLFHEKTKIERTQTEKKNNFPIIICSAIAIAILFTLAVIFALRK